MSMFRRRSMLAALAVAGVLSLLAADHAEARRAGSFGSRGTRTYQSPAPTTTAPGTVAPIQRSATPQAAPSPSPAASARPQTASRPSMFGGGLGGALMRGLLIGGLVGLLLGNGLGGLAGVLGLLLQVALVALAAFLVLRLLRGPQPVPAGAASGPRPGGARPGEWRAARASPAGGGSSARPGPRDEIGITPADLDTFERLLGVIQTAFGQEDQGVLKANTTPEIFAFLSDELGENAERGVRNAVSDVKLLQGDLAEAWREGTRDYATVAMRYASRDAMVDRATGRVVGGDRAGVSESTEVWTFTRERGGPWVLGAIQGS